MRLAVDIGRIVLEDASLVAGRAERLGALVEAEVERRLRSDPLANVPRGREGVEARPLGVAPASDEELARELADRVVESIRGGAS